MNKTVVGKKILSFAFIVLALETTAQDFAAGEPLGSVNEAGQKMVMSDNVKVFGSFHFTESCTFDANKNLILAMNAGNRGEDAAPMVLFL